MNCTENEKACHFCISNLSFAALTRRCTPLKSLPAISPQLHRSCSPEPFLPSIKATCMRALLMEPVRFRARTPSALVMKADEWLSQSRSFTTDASKCTGWLPMHMCQKRDKVNWTLKGARRPNISRVLGLCKFNRWFIGENLWRTISVIGTPKVSLK